MIERNPTVDLTENAVRAEVELVFDPGYKLRVVRDDSVQINSDCNVYGAMVAIANAIERAGQWSANSITFRVEFERKESSDV